MMQIFTHNIMQWHNIIGKNLGQGQALDKDRKLQKSYLIIYLYGVDPSIKIYLGAEFVCFFFDLALDLSLSSQMTTFLTQKRDLSEKKNHHFCENFII